MQEAVERDAGDEPRATSAQTKPCGFFDAGENFRSLSMCSYAGYVELGRLFVYGMNAGG